MYPISRTDPDWLYRSIDRLLHSVADDPLMENPILVED